jgi:hypothetical protein
MATVDDVYQSMLKTARKNQSGFLSRTDFEKFYNLAQYQYFNDLKGRFQRSTVATGGTFNDETITTKLSPFVTTNATVIVSAGVAFKPSNFVRLQAMRTVSGKMIQLVSYDKLASRINSAIDPLTTEAPVYIQSASSWLMFPNTVSSVVVDYLRLPIKVVWGFTVNGQGREVYNPVTSINPEWLDDDAQEIAIRALKLFGVSIKDGELIGLGEQTNVKGE